MAWANILDLCSCMALTLRDRKHIADYLTWNRYYGPPSAEKAKAFIRKAFLEDSVINNKQLSLIHRCDGYPFFQAEIKLSLTEAASKAPT